MRKLAPRNQTARMKNKRRDLAIGANVFDLNERTLVMGILNVTPDSFYDGGRFYSKEKAVGHALKLIKEGADIIDIGGHSTRPGALRISLQEEMDRVIPVIEELVRREPVAISVDTFNADVAERALNAGSVMVNDVTGLMRDDKMAGVIADKNASVIIMHMKGTPRNMQLNPEYEDVISEVMLYLKQAVVRALDAGIERERIIIDPGIGFGKKVSHNYEIIDKLYMFRSLELPVMIGVSRKSFMGEVLNLKPEDRLIATAASTAISIVRGADIIRVHDVGQMKQVAMVSDAVLKKGNII